MQIIDRKQLIIVASVALVNSDNQILIAQRPKEKHLSGLWEFPGGKVEKDESPENTLIRELKEELNVNINQKALHALQQSSIRYWPSPKGLRGEGNITSVGMQIRVGF